MTGLATNPEDARRIAAASQPDVITLDVRLGASAAAGIQLASDLRRLSPGSRILVLSVSGRERDVAALLAIGIAGYVLKGEPPAVVASAIRAAAAGRAYFSASIDWIVRRLVRSGGPLPLQPDEVVILKLLARGLSRKEIAAALTLSVRTVARRVNTIFEKLEVTNRVEAIIKAKDLGYVNGYQ